ncbi:hypothetical protein F5887DRAFT_999058 [Amanita rubescens]|nr:hypothetical protein F5887DRAFT_999058 [Amanita rubescens]
MALPWGAMHWHFHTCLDSLTKYAGNFWGRGPDQPACIQELSITLKKGFSVHISSVKPRDAFCHLCQIAHRIDRVTELGQYLQINERPGKNFPGAFVYWSDNLYLELERECYGLIRTLKIIIENDLNRTLSPPPAFTAPPAPYPPPPNEKGVSSSMFPSARDVHINDSTVNNIAAGGSNVDIGFASPPTMTVNRVLACLLLAAVSYIFVKKIF